MISRTTRQKYKRSLLCLISLVGFSLLVNPVQAAYITDKIVIEVYSQRLSQGAVLKKLSSGSSVEVLMTDGDYSRIRTSDNITGWVESKYISNEQPTQIEYLTLLTKSKTLEEKLKNAEAKLSSGGGASGADGNSIDGIDIAELEELRKRAADAGWMRVELKKARDRANELEKNVQPSGQNDKQSEEQLTALRNQNKELQRRLAAAIAFNEQQGMTTLEDGTVTTTTSQNTTDQGWMVNIQWFLGSIIAALIVGLVGGMVWLDKRIRQRHGGFRIY